MLDQRLEGGEQDRQALALLGAADEEQAQLVARRLRALRRGLDVDAVGDDRVLAAEPAPPGPGGRLGDGDPRRELVEAPPGAEQGRDVVREGLGRVGVEGPDDRGAAEGRGVPADERRRRLVDVDDVVVAGAQLAAQGDRSLREGRRGSRPRRWRRCRPCARAGRGSREPPAARVGAVQAAADDVRRVPGGEHADVVSAGYELLRERLDVPVDASLVGPGIGRDKRYAHGVRVPGSLASFVHVSHQDHLPPSGAQLRVRTYRRLPAPAPRRRPGSAQGEGAERQECGAGVVDEDAHGDGRAGADQARPRAGPAGARRRSAASARRTAMPTMTIQKRGLPAAWAKSCAESSRRR